MDKQSKIFEVENLKVKIKDAKSTAIADFRGITVAQISQLRNKVKEAGGELQVVKNTLFRRALRENNYKVEENKLDGPSLALFAYNDEISPLKVFAAFGKGLNLLPFKVGFIGGKVYLAEDLNLLASLPSKIELQAKLVGMLAGQPGRLVRSLNYNIQKLVLVLNAVKSKKQ